MPENFPRPLQAKAEGYYHDFANLLPGEKVIWFAPSAQLPNLFLLSLALIGALLVLFIILTILINPLFMVGFLLTVIVGLLMLLPLIAYLCFRTRHRYVLTTERLIIKANPDGPVVNCNFNQLLNVEFKESKLFPRIKLWTPYPEIPSNINPDGNLREYFERLHEVWQKAMEDVSPEEIEGLRKVYFPQMKRWLIFCLLVSLILDLYPNLILLSAAFNLPAFVGYIGYFVFIFGILLLGFWPLPREIILGREFRIRRRVSSLHTGILIGSVIGFVLITRLIISWLTRIWF